MKHFTSINDVTDLQALIDLAFRYKKNPRLDHTLGQHKRIGLLFFNPSMRTRLSSQIASSNLGMEAIVFNVGQEGWTLEFGEDTIMNGTTVEHIRDAAPVLGRYFDLLGVRTFPTLKHKEDDYSEQAIQQFIRYAGIPVISLESATLHPLQSLADIITMEELLPAAKKPKVVLTWAPHVKALPQCVANSFAQWVTGWGKADFVIAHPRGMNLAEKFTQGTQVTSNQDEALEGADFVYVKNWSSYIEYGVLAPPMPAWMLTNQKLSITNKARVMHCLPVRRNVELGGDVLDGPLSVVTEQAANRVWAAQAVMASILKTS